MAFVAPLLRAQENIPQPASTYEYSLTHLTTSPYYIKIAVTDLNKNVRFSTCTPAPFLLGAIHFQTALPYTKQGIDDALNIAVSQRDHEFSFDSEKAIRNITPKYSAEQLLHAREKYGAYDTKLLREMFSTKSGGGEIRFGPSFAAERDAVACILIERGFEVWRADLGGQIFVN